VLSGQKITHIVSEDMHAMTEYVISSKYSIGYLLGLQNLVRYSRVCVLSILYYKNWSTFDQVITKINGKLF